MQLPSGRSARQRSRSAESGISREPSRTATRAATIHYRAPDVASADYSAISPRRDIKVVHICFTLASCLWSQKCHTRTALRLNFRSVACRVCRRPHTTHKSQPPRCSAGPCCVLAPVCHHWPTERACTAASHRKNTTPPPPFGSPVLRVPPAQYCRRSARIGLVVSTRAGLPGDTPPAAD